MVVYFKVLNGEWANASADGKKFECIANRKKWKNEFGRLEINDLIVIVAKGGFVCSICVVNNFATKSTDKTKLYEMVNFELIPSLDEYLQNANSFDVVFFKQNLDVRRLDMQLNDFCTLHSFAIPTFFMGLQRLANTNENLQYLFHAEYCNCKGDFEKCADNELNYD